ncbi:MAG: hypothetical protein MR601_07535 [Erysipelotrichaceae bacterium]|nr:hypothetical protein [Erysipelotrichaceae bacterium]
MKKIVKIFLFISILLSLSSIQNLVAEEDKIEYEEVIYENIKNEDLNITDNYKEIKEKNDDITDDSIVSDETINEDIILENENLEELDSNTVENDNLFYEEIDSNADASDISLLENDINENIELNPILDSNVIDENSIEEKNEVSVDENKEENPELFIEKDKNEYEINVFEQFDEKSEIEKIIDEQNTQYKQLKEYILDNNEILNILNGNEKPFKKIKSQYRSSEDFVECYINNFELIKTYDGTAPFDINDDKGNDSSFDNKIVRSFDKVVYRTAYSTLSKNILDTSMSGRFYLKAILPVSSKIASFDIKAMEWIENLTVDIQEDYSVLEGYIDVENQVVSPRVGVINWVISINQAFNNTTILAPTFYIGLNDKNYLSVVGENLRVSAKPNINAKINYEGIFDDKQLFSIVLELYSDVKGKGIKGQEILNDNESISFKLFPNDNHKIIDYKVNDNSTSTFLKNEIYGKLAPISGKNSSDFNMVFNSGEINIVDNFVTINNFKFDNLYNKVTNNSNKNNSLQGFDYDDDRYPFGSYVFLSDIPDNIINNKFYTFKITDLIAKDKLGEEILETNIDDNIAGYTLGKPEGGGSGGGGGPAQFLTINVINSSTKERFTLIGKDATRNIPPDYYVYPNDLVSISQGAMMYKNFDRAYMKQYLGFIKFDTNFFEVLKNDEQFSNPIPNNNLRNLQFNWVCKENKNGWNSEEEMYNTHIDDIKNQNGFKLYNDVNSAINDGCKVIGFFSVSEFVNPNYNISFDAFGTYPAIRVKKDVLIDKSTNKLLEKDNPKRVGVILGELEGIDFDGNIYKRYNVFNSLGDDLDMYKNHKDIKLGFIKAKYDKNGIISISSSSNAIGNRNGNWTHAASLVGGAFFVKDYNTYINTHISQKINDTTNKEVFNLDMNQYNVYFDIESGTSLDTMVNITDDFEIIQRIPSTIKPFKNDSNIEKKWNIVYDGEIINDNSQDGININNYSTNFLTSKTCLNIPNNIIRYEVEEKIDGEYTEIIWKIYNYPVSYKLPKIHFAGKIDENIGNNQNIVLNSIIKSKNMLSTNVDNIGLKTIRIGGATISKVANPIIRNNKPIKFNIEFSNQTIFFDSSENIDAIIYDDLDSNNVLGNYFLNNIDLISEIYNKDKNSSPKIRFIYSNVKKDLNLDSLNSILDINNYEFIDLSLTKNNDIYYIDDDSIGNIKNILKNEKIREIAFCFENIGYNSKFSLSYEYDWNDKNEKIIKENNLTVENIAYLKVFSNINQVTFDKAISYPNILKEITKINDKKSEDINGLNNSLVKENDIIEYKINFINTKNENVKVTIFDKIPTGTQIIETSISDGGIYDKKSNNIKWEFSNVKPNMMKSVLFSVKVIDDNTITIENRGRIKFDDDPFIETNVIINPKIKLSAYKDSNVKNGSIVNDKDKIEYYIKIKNESNFDIENIKVKDKIPKNTLFHKVNNGYFMENLNEVYFDIPLIKSNEEITVSFVVVVDSNNKSVEIENSAHYGIEIPNKKTNTIYHYTNNKVIKYDVVETGNKSILLIYIITIFISGIGMYFVNKK